MMEKQHRKIPRAEKEGYHEIQGYAWVPKLPESRSGRNDCIMHPTAMQQRLWEAHCTSRCEQPKVLWNYAQLKVNQNMPWVAWDINVELDQRIARKTSNALKISCEKHTSRLIIIMCILLDFHEACAVQHQIFARVAQRKREKQEPDMKNGCAFMIRAYNVIR